MLPCLPQQWSPGRCLLEWPLHSSFASSAYVPVHNAKLVRLKPLLTEVIFFSRTETLYFFTHAVGLESRIVFVCW